MYCVPFKRLTHLKTVECIFSTYSCLDPLSHVYTRTFCGQIFVVNLTLIILESNIGTFTSQFKVHYACAFVTLIKLARSLVVVEASEKVTKCYYGSTSGAKC